MRIAIMGYSGSGKSTLARNLSGKLGIPALHMDRLHFQKNWVERSDQAALYILRPWLDQENWIIEGNYRSLLFQQRAEMADRIIILQLPRFTCLRRAWIRSRQYKGKTRPDMAPGCHEKFDWEFFWWLLYAGRKKSRMGVIYESLQQQYPEKCHICRTQKDIDRLLESELL